MLHQLYSGLTTIQSASALTFSVFYITHASQFLAAPFGGVELSNKYLLLGRPLYQDEHLEGILVTGAVTTHVLSGLAKGAIRLYWRRKNESSSITLPSTSYAVPYHRLAGYALLPIVALHYKVVRDLPQQHFGDSAFLDYSYIAFLLQKYPACAYIGHAALISVASYHIVGGMNIAINQLFKRKIINRNQDLQKVDDNPPKHSVKDIKRLQVYTSLAISGLAVCGLYVIGMTEKIPLRREYAKIVQKITF